MSARVSVQLSPESGRTVAVKVATGPDEAERLAAEADLLRRHHHPGIARLVDYRTTETGAELHTPFVGPSLDHWHGTTGQIAGLGAALASTLEELHRAGTAHGRLDRSHVLLGADGRPVLCGLSGAADGEASPADDVRCLGHLLTDLLDETSSPRRSLKQLLEPTGPRRRLGLVAARATTTAPERRPTARALAQQILDAVPDACLPDGHPGREEPPEVVAGAGPDPVGAHAEDDLSRSTHPVDAHEAPGVDDEDDHDDDHAAFAAAFVDLSDTDENDIFSDRPWVETVYTDTPLHGPRAVGRPDLGWEEAAVAEFDAAPARRKATGDGEVRHDTDRSSGTERPDRVEGPRSDDRLPTDNRPRNRRPGGARWDEGNRRRTGRRAGARRGRRHLAGAALALTGAVGVTGGVLAATMSSDAGTARSTTDDAAADPSSARDDAAPCPGTDADTGSDPAEVVATYQVDMTGDGCVETVAVTTAGVVESRQGRWVVGEPEDRITLGDWDCDGTATPAVLRPSTGAVFVFPDWAEPGTPMSIEPLARTPDGQEVLTEPADGDAGCDTPVVELADGSHQIMEVSPR